MNKKNIIDCSLSIEEALAQKPDSIAPAELIKSQRLISVIYFSFDNHLHEGQIVIHKDLVNDITDFFKLAMKLKFPIEKAIPISIEKYAWDDIKSCDDNNSAGFNYRKITANPTKLSKHATGCAFDINPTQNIYVKYDESENELFRFPKDGIYDSEKAGTLTKNHPLVLLLKDRGWTWGGDWTPASGREDYQHFEKDLYS